VSNEIELQINALIDALRIKVQEEKKRYDAAIDIEDMAEAKVVMFDARAKIQQLRKWTESLVAVQSEISNSFLVSDKASIKQAVVPQIVAKKESEPEEAETIQAPEPDRSTEDTPYSSAGEYVRQKLYQLSRSGFAFSEDQLKNLQDSMWSRRILGLPHQFARIYDENKDILKQTSIAGTPRRYWVKDRFKFGEITLLIYSGWASIYLPYFDTWYNSLNNQIEESSGEQPISESPIQIVEPLQLEEAVSEQVKVGYYIRSKLRELCETDFQPSENELLLWQDKIWSKRVLNLNYPFAKVFSERDYLSEQTRAENGKNRYWAEVFKPGTTKLLFCSQWYRQDREYFDCWFNSLNTQNANDKTLPKSEPQLTESIQSPQFDTTEKPFLPEPVYSSEYVDSDVPNGFSLLGRTYSVAGWDDVLVKLCEAMILKKPYKTLAIGVKKSLQINGNPVLWLDERGESSESYKLSNGLIVVKNKTSGEIITCCERILNLCGYDRSELKIS
jgi:hypothetical protein